MQQVGIIQQSHRPVIVRADGVLIVIPPADDA